MGQLLSADAVTGAAGTGAAAAEPAEPVVQGPYHRFNRALYFVLDSMDARTLATVASVNRTASQVCKMRIANTVWRRRCLDDWGAHAVADVVGHLGSADLDTISWHGVYVTLRSIWLEDELNYVSKIAYMQKPVYQYTQWSAAQPEALLGVLADLAICDRRDVAMVLSRKRRSAMHNILVQGDASIRQIKQSPAFSNNPKILGSLSFYPVPGPRAAHMGLVEQLPAVTAPGCLGYAVHLLRLRPEHEFLREQCLFVLFRDLLIFETTAHAVAYQGERFSSGEHAPLWYVALDTYNPETEDDGPAPNAQPIDPTVVLPVPVAGAGAGAGAGATDAPPLPRAAGGWDPAAVAATAGFPATRAAARPVGDAAGAADPVVEPEAPVSGGAAGAAAEGVQHVDDEHAAAAAPAVPAAPRRMPRRGFEDVDMRANSTYFGVHFAYRQYREPISDPVTHRMKLLKQLALCEISRAQFLASCST